MLRTPARSQHSSLDLYQDYKGKWEMASYSVQMTDGEVEHEYQILLDARSPCLWEKRRLGSSYAFDAGCVIDACTCTSPVIAPCSAMFVKLCVMRSLSGLSRTLSLWTRGPIPMTVEFDARYDSVHRSQRMKPYNTFRVAHGLWSFLNVVFSQAHNHSKTSSLIFKCALLYTAHRVSREWRRPHVGSH